MRIRANLTSLFAAIILGSGCGGDGDGGTGSYTPSLTGRWTARIPALDYDVVDFTLVAGQGGTVSGSGFIQSNGKRNVSIQGVHNHPNVSLTLNGEAMCTGSFTGAFTDDNTISGTAADTRGDCRPGAWTLKRQ
jgi:hypothetical protein